jgi:RNA polymerase sigma factor (TIGR02999 family)
MGECNASGSSPGAITMLLRDWSCGDPEARDRLLPLVYRELRRQAARFLRRERHNHTLVATALVHEAYLRLDGQETDYASRVQFFALAARMMRRVLVDHARARSAAKRPRSELQVLLEEGGLSIEPRPFELLVLDRGLEELAAFDPRQARLVELRYFGGLTAAETAQVMGLSPTTIKREWNLAKAWLHRYLTRSSPEPGQP